MARYLKKISIIFRNGPMQPGSKESAETLTTVTTDSTSYVQTADSWDDGGLDNVALYNALPVSFVLPDDVEALERYQFSEAY